MAEHAVVLQQQVATVVVEVLRTQVVEVQAQPVTVEQSGGEVLAVQQCGTALAIGMQPGALVVQPVMAAAVVAVGIQGPPGRDADAVTGALLKDNRLSEYAGDDAAQKEVQHNIGLGALDPLSFYLLAKS